MHPGRGDYGTCHGVLILIEEGDLLQAYQPKEVYIPLNVGERILSHCIEVGLARAI